MQQPVVVDASAVYYGRVPIRPLSVILGLGDLDRIATGYAVFATIFAIVGFFTMIYSATIPLNVRMLIGWLLLIAGVMTALLAIYSYGTPGYIPLFLLATAHIFFGAIMLSDMSGHGDKVANVATIAPWFFAQGILKVLLASALRCFSTWPLVFVSGMISITLGTAVWTTYPAMEQWVIGVLVGADLVITALTLGFTACMASYGYALISSQDDDDEAGACPT